MIDWITTDEATDLSGYHVVHLRRLIHAGKVHAEKKGGQWWVDCASLRKFLHDTAQSPDGRRGGRSPRKPGK